MHRLQETHMFSHKKQHALLVQTQLLHCVQEATYSFATKQCAYCARGQTWSHARNISCANQKEHVNNSYPQPPGLGPGNQAQTGDCEFVLFMTAGGSYYFLGFNTFSYHAYIHIYTNVHIHENDQTL